VRYRTHFKEKVNIQEYQQHLFVYMDVIFIVLTVIVSTPEGMVREEMPA
jgi:hypothetical protein